MGKILTVQNPKGRQIQFDEDQHKYYDEKGQIYHSTTKIIHSLFPEFPRDMMAYVTARKRIMKEEGYADKSDVPVPQCMELKKVVLDEWEENKNLACDIGTEVHRYAECLLKGEPFDISFTASKQEKMAKVLDDFIPNLLKQYKFIESEKIIFTPSIRLAGTVDLIMENRQTGKLCIFDWKTNKALNQKDSYGKKGLLFLNHLDHCNYFHYTLQLSIYKKILCDEGYGDFSNCELGLFHINTRRVQGYQLSYLEWETEQIFNYVEGLRSH